MIEVTTSYELKTAAPRFARLAKHHLSVAAVLAGTIDGGIWVDQLHLPRVGFAMTPEGSYLAGDPHAEHSYVALRELIPQPAYLTVEPAEWAGVLEQVWTNRFARPHPRRTYRLHTLRMADWRERLPNGYSAVNIDQEFLQRTDVRGIEHIAGRSDAWPSQDAFIEQNHGVCILYDGEVVSHSIADCVVGTRCELGVGTHLEHRRRGLGSIATAAAVERALTAGIKDIGWHCLRSNRGSMAVAEKVGFELEAEYTSYSLSLPAENAGDLSTAECVDWAQHCEHAADEISWSAFFAAGAWVQAGETTKAIANLRRLVDSHWRGRPEWLESSWMFAGLRGTPEFQQILLALRE